MISDNTENNKVRDNIQVEVEIANNEETNSKHIWTNKSVLKDDEPVWLRDAGDAVFIKTKHEQTDITDDEYWENLLEHPHYNTDSGNGRFSEYKGSVCLDVTRKGGDKKLGTATGPNCIDLKTAFAMMREMPGQPMLLIRTSRRGTKSPGSFYAKGFRGKGCDLEELKTALNNNQSNNRFSTRKAWVFE